MALLEKTLQSIAQSTLKLKSKSWTECLQNRRMVCAILNSHKNLVCLFLCLLVVAPLTAQTQPDDIQFSQSNRTHFIAYGDTRFTDPANTQVANAEARRDLVKAIANAHPEFITFGGDLTYNGGNPADWKVYDSETAVWRENHIPVYPALGNHDLFGDPKINLASYFQHFPEIEHSLYYSVSTGNLLLLTLDSALDETSGAQGDWLKSKLDSLSPGIDFVVIVLHHPPYTSSAEGAFGAGHSARPAEQALARLLEDRQQKMRARIVVFASHVHNYEHFEHGGVPYFVTGGGGAHPYLIQRRPTDLFQGAGVNYHYIDVTVEPGKMVAIMNRLELKNGGAKWTQPETVTIIAPAQTKAAAAK
ncbi:MAG TPA: metallophosphoesterase [Candidatus Angelobacter sp.]|jgi:Icc-related predicted phosphoesterase